MNVYNEKRKMFQVILECSCCRGKVLYECKTKRELADLCESTIKDLGEIPNIPGNDPMKETTAFSPPENPPVSLVSL